MIARSDRHQYKAVYQWDTWDIIHAC